MKFLKSLPFLLLVGVAAGIGIGLIANASVMSVVVTISYLLGQLISFCVPLIIIAFIAPSITKLGSNASRMLGIALCLAYISSVLAALVSSAAGYAIIPNLSIIPATEALKELPPVIFQLMIPEIMPVMSALVFSIVLGLAATATRSKTMIQLLQEFQEIILLTVTRLIIPILPFYIASTFCSLAYEGSITKQFPIFLKVIVIVLAGHFIWMTFLYLLAGIYAKKNPLEVVRHYGAAYLTAVGTMSSAATLAVALRCAGKSTILRKDMVSFGIPLFANIHLCGSVLTEVFFVMTVSQILYGQLPPVGTMVLFCVLLAVFAVGAPGVPGGTVMASLGIIVSILGFNDTGTALILTIFALQDSFGTACNVTSDGALTLMLSAYADRHQIKGEATA